MILSEISKLTEEEARELLENIRWAGTPKCPHCPTDQGSYRLTESKKKRVRAGLYGCKGCGKQFTVTVGTVMEQSHIPIRTWLMAFSIMCASKKGVSALQLQRQLGLGSYRTAWHMCHRVRYAMKQEPLQSLLLTGEVEVDETYVGGKPRHMKGTAHIGRGTKKAAVVALVERGGRVCAKHIPSVTGKNLKDAIRQNVDPSATIYTDDLNAYTGIGAEFAGGHHAVRHLAGEYVRGRAHTQNVEAFFGILKRSVTGSWHHVSKKHLDRYVTEVGFRWNYRKESDATQTFAAIKQSEGKRLLYKSTVSE